MPRFRLTMVGTRALLMHNSRLANPLDPVKQQLSELTAKKSKTIPDYEEIAHAEFIGGMYYHRELGPVMPTENIYASLIAGARFQRKGAALERGLQFDDEVTPLLYDGPRDLTGLWEEKEQAEDGQTVRRFCLMKIVVVMRARTLRARPRFAEWGLQVTGRFADSQIDFKDIELAASNAGEWVGLGDGTPRYGRFDASVQLIDDEEPSNDGAQSSVVSSV